MTTTRIFLSFLLPKKLMSWFFPDDCRRSDKGHKPHSRLWQFHVIVNLRNSKTFQHPQAVSFHWAAAKLDEMEPSFWKQPATNLHDLLKPSTSHENGDINRRCTEWRHPAVDPTCRISLANFISSGGTLAHLIHYSRSRAWYWVIYANSSFDAPNYWRSELTSDF
jgi:hypothetical protein